MTPGQLALLEASRLESARVYAVTLEQHRSLHERELLKATAAQRRRAELESAITVMYAQGLTALTIAFRLGTSKQFVCDALARVADAHSPAIDPPVDQQLQAEERIA